MTGSKIGTNEGLFLVVALCRHCTNFEPVTPWLAAEPRTLVLILPAPGSCHEDICLRGAARLHKNNSCLKEGRCVSIKKHTFTSSGAHVLQINISHYSFMYTYINVRFGKFPRLAQILTKLNREVIILHLRSFHPTGMGINSISLFHSIVLHLSNSKLDQIIFHLLSTFED